MEFVLSNGWRAEIVENYSDDGKYDIYIYDIVGVLIDMDFARSDNVNQLLEEAEWMFGNK